MFTFIGNIARTSADSTETSQCAKEKAMLLELQDILRNKDIRVVFQPIVSLFDGSVLGYEALSRGPRGSLLEFPDDLFPAATKFDLVWELEYLCRVAALEKAKNMVAKKMLFINVDPNIIKDPRFEKGRTRKLLKTFQADIGNVIFEITEKSAINDFIAFRRVLDNYTSQGYKIAIDDTGSGYSGLRMLAQTNPHFIKVDMELVRDIDKDGLKQAMMKAIYDFSVLANSKIIAEGIETKDELITLINLGIPYGQGYFLQKPDEEFRDIVGPVREIITARNEIKKREAYQTARNIPIGQLARQDRCFPSSMQGYQALDYFTNTPSLQGIPIVDEGKPVGLLMKNKFLANLATQYGVAVYMNRDVNKLMDQNPLIVDYHTPLEMVSKSAIARPEDHTYDYIIIVKDGKYFGTVTIKRLLEKTMQIEVTCAKHANPLTGLPGNIIIENQLTQTINASGEYAILYFDLDNFKSYNDVYGFENGDKILRYTADVIQQCLDEKNFAHYFLGHVGGDDFIATVPTTAVEQLCEKIITAFDHDISGFYSAEDRERGYILAINRHGIEERFPLATISIAVVTNKARNHSSVAEIGELAGMIKKQCKMSWQSCYIID